MAVKVKEAAAPAIEPVIQTALSLEYAKVADLQAYENNPRDNDSEVPKMVELIKTFGFKVPVLVRGNRIVDGHLRIKAATELGLAEVPVIDVGEMGEPYEQALRIALNKSVEWADWNEDLLGQEMQAIMDAGLNPSLTGFANDEVDNLIKSLAAENPPIPGDLKDPNPKVTKNKDADAGTPADPGHVSITFHMAAQNRDELLKRLETYRTDQQLVNHSQALIAMVKIAADEWALGLS